MFRILTYPVADPEQAFGGQSNKGCQNVFTVLRDNRWVSHKRGCLLWAEKVAISLVELCNLSWNHNSFKSR